MKKLLIPRLKLALQASVTPLKRGIATPAFQKFCLRQNRLSAALLLQGSLRKGFIGVAILIICLPLLFLSACFALPTEAPAMLPPTVAARNEPRPFTTIPVSRGDVRDFAAPFTQMAAGTEASVAFEVGGVPIYGIFVIVGDYVQEGDLIASLYFPGLTEEIEDLTRTSADLTMRLEHARQRHDMALNLAEVSGNPVDDLRFANEIHDISAELEVINWHLGNLRTQDAIRHIWAPIGGVVTQALEFTEGRLSSAGSRVATISEASQPFFLMRTPEYVRRLNVGDLVDMYIGDSLFVMEVVNPEEHGLHRRPEWTVAAFLIFADDEPAFIPGNSGQLNIVFNEALDVIYIPTRYLQRAGERYFVFLYEDGVRAIRDVVPGLFGNHTVEIVSGLEEGELLMR